MMNEETHGKTLQKIADHLAVLQGFLFGLDARPDVDCEGAIVTLSDLAKAVAAITSHNERRKQNE